MLDTIRLVNKHIGSSTNSNLARRFVNGDSFQGLGVVNVDRLEELLRTSENDQCMTGNVGLHRTTEISNHDRCYNIVRNS